MPLKELQKKVYDCQQCRLFHNGHCFSNMIDSRIMVIGQNPGAEEIERGKPFQGVTGRRLFKHLPSAKKYYITNAVKCAGDCSKTNCPWLYEEIEIIKPKHIITLGNIAYSKVKHLLYPIYKMYHPSPSNNTYFEQFKAQAAMWEKHYA